MSALKRLSFKSLRNNFLETYLQFGQLWVYFLNPGRQLTRQLAIQDPQKQQIIAQAHPLPEILESTLVEI